MSPIMWSGKSASVEAAMKNMLAAATQEILDQWRPYDEEDEERRDRSQQELEDLDRAGDPSPEGSPPPKGRTSKHKANKKAAKELHERVIYYKTESDRKYRLNRRNNNGFAHAGTVDGYMQGNHIRQIGAPPRSPTEDSQNPHHHPPQPHPRRRGFSFGGLFKSNKKKPLSPPSPVLPHHEGSLDSYEERPPRQGPLPPAQDVHHSQYHQEPGSPSKLLKRHGSTSSRTRGHDNYPPPQMQSKISSREGGDYADRPHKSSSNRHRDRDRDRDGYRDKDRDRDRGTDPSRSSRRHEKSHSYEDRRYPPSSRRDLGGSDRYGSSRHREGSRERERSSRHRDDDYRHGSSSHRHRSSRKKHYSDDDDEDSEERRRRRRERREREKDRDRRKHDDPPEEPPSAHDQASMREGSHHGGDFHDAASVHDSEHKPRDDHDALSVSDHLNGGLHVSG